MKNSMALLVLLPPKLRFQRVCLQGPFLKLDHVEPSSASAATLEQLAQILGIQMQQQLVSDRDEKDRREKTRLEAERIEAEARRERKEDRRAEDRRHAKMLEFAMMAIVALKGGIIDPKMFNRQPDESDDDTSESEKKSAN